VTELSAVAEVQAALERGQHELVLESTAAMLAGRPGNDAAHELRARALLALGRLDEAEAEASDAVRLDPDEVRYRELLAEVLAARGAHRDAAAEFGSLARADPRHADWTVAEARERLEAAQPEMGVEAARRALRLNPEDFAAQLALAQGLVRLGDPGGAMGAATRAAHLRPADLQAREALADARWLNDDAAPALDEFASLASALGGAQRARVIRKARALYRQRSGPVGQLIASVPPLFRFALARGWLRLP
jgi:tetratricopeptide (TPR) repeat protein